MRHQKRAGEAEPEHKSDFLPLNPCDALLTDSPFLPLFVSFRRAQSSALLVTLIPQLSRQIKIEQRESR